MSDKAERAAAKAAKKEAKLLETRRKSEAKLLAKLEKENAKQAKAAEKERLRRLEKERKVALAAEKKQAKALRKSASAAAGLSAAPAPAPAPAALRPAAVPRATSFHMGSKFEFSPQENPNVRSSTQFTQGAYRPKQEGQTLSLAAHQPYPSALRPPPQRSTEAPLSIGEATAIAQQAARELAQARSSESERVAQSLETQRARARLEAARRAADQAAGMFASETNPEPPAHHRRGLPAGALFGSQENLEDDSETDGEFSLGGAATRTSYAPDVMEEGESDEEIVETEGDLSFEQIMDKAMSLGANGEELPAAETDQDQASTQDDQSVPPELQGPPEKWEVERAIKDGDIEELEVLAELGADLNFRDDDGHTPLHRAVDAEKEEIADALCRLGADINAQTEDGLLWTALHIASLNGYPAMVKILLKHNADRTVLDARKETALQWAEANHEEECIALLRA
eukprot:m.4972 g.4972  ORF g.4972 m.4972 type:complete len:458 (+) comp2472_c0_seq1:244-1617(+)